MHYLEEDDSNDDCWRDYDAGTRIAQEQEEEMSAWYEEASAPRAYETYSLPSSFIVPNCAPSAKLFIDAVRTW